MAVVIPFPLLSTFVLWRYAGFYVLLFRTVTTTAATATIATATDVNEYSLSFQHDHFQL